MYPDVHPGGEGDRIHGCRRSMDTKGMCGCHHGNSVEHKSHNIGSNNGAISRISKNVDNNNNGCSSRGRIHQGHRQTHTGNTPLRRCWIVYIFALASCVDIVRAQLVGTDKPCTLPNGSPIFISGISNHSCISCYCQDGVVECARSKCPSRDLCPVIPEDKPKHQCCPCKGCTHRGQFHESGTTWVDPKKLCKRYTCQAGVVTGYKTQCHVICKHPIFPNNSCCPLCEGCKIDGVTHRNGETFPSPKDPLAICTCQNGTVGCVRQACPVLNCPERYFISTPGSYCLQCSQSRRFYLPPKGCFFRQSITKNRGRINPDPCTKCTCVNETVVCTRRVCPVMHCAHNDVTHDPLTCCPKCKKRKKPCRLKGKSHKHGSTWWPDECTSCECDDSTVRCHVQQCHNKVDCPKGQRLSHTQGKCCPICVDSDAVCAVFGDPHYRTFDGRIYNFQGMCRYILAQDCHGGNFSIRVRNDARLTNDFAWTKSVSIILRKDVKISFHQNLKVKVNGKVTSLPYNKPHVVDVVKGGRSVTLKTSFGLKVNWDGDSYLEVTVPPSMKHKVCGLCGNYNGIQSDDFIGRGGGLYLDANEFAESWKLGRGRTCNKNKSNRKVLRQQSTCDKNIRRRRKAEADCSILKSPAFARCRLKVDVRPYYVSCLVDVCDCPSDKQCSCEAITAYSRQCSREGVNVVWRTPSICGAPLCPKGSVFNVCASACPRTCANRNRPTSCAKPCIAACQCAHGTVLRGKKCVTPDRCKHKRRRSKKFGLGLLRIS